MWNSFNEAVRPGQQNGPNNGMSLRGLLEQMDSISNRPLPAAPQLPENPSTTNFYQPPLFTGSPFGMYSPEGKFDSQQLATLRALQGHTRPAVDTQYGPTNAGPMAGIYGTQMDQEGRTRNALMQGLLGAADISGINGMPGTHGSRAINAIAQLQDNETRRQVGRDTSLQHALNNLYRGGRTPTIQQINQIREQFRDRER